MIKDFISDLRYEFNGYNAKKLSGDLMSGLTVTAVALPLALAFGVSSGATAAAGLITAIIAGIFIGGFSGASYQISGPTGAMTAILLTLCAKYGMQGMFLSTFLAGVILIVAALFKVGRVVSFIPSPVITGFTSGIAVIIALGQVDNFFGTVSKGENAISKLISYGELGFSPNLISVAIGILVIVVMLAYPKKWNSKFPSSLVGIIIATAVSVLIKADVKTIGEIPKTIFLADRLSLSGIDFTEITSFFTPAISIAALCIIESLLCGASAGKMKHEKLNADREILAQGIGNIIIPFFGGVPATAAIARTSVAIKSGGNTRLVSIFHSIGLLISMFLLGGVMSKIPLSALAGVLMVTAWRMNEWDSIKNIFKRKMVPAVLQFTITMISTVVFDLTVAIVIGIAFSVLLFFANSCKLRIDIAPIDTEKLGKEDDIFHHTRAIYVTGPLFFGNQEKFINAIKDLPSEIENMIFSMRGVPNIDQSAITAILEFFEEHEQKKINIYICGASESVKQSLDKSGFSEVVNAAYCWDAVEAIRKIEEAKKLA